MSEPNPDYLDVRHRVRYTKDYATPLSILMLGLIVLVAGLCLFIYLQFHTRLKPLTFPLTDNMQIIEPVPLEQEGVTKPQLLNWLNEALIIAFSFNYSNIDKQESKVAPYFGSNALQVYLDMLKLDEDFALVTTKHYVVSIQATETPEILTSKAFKGRYAWQIRVPVLITFSNAMYLNQQQADFEFLVWRVPETESPMGITIASFSRQVIGRSGVRPVNTFQ